MLALIAQLLQFDHFLFNEINKVWVNPVFDMIFPNITDLYKTPGFLLAAGLVCLTALVRTRGRAGLAILFLLLSIGASDLIGSKLLKDTIQRNRPEFAGVEPILKTHSHSGWSMPSNHALNCFTAAAFLGFLFPTARFAFLFVAFLVAYSRVYVGVHFPSDIFVGSILGVLVATLMYRAFLKVRERLLRRSQADIPV